MLSINKSNMIEDKDATLSNLKLLIGSEKRGLFGDPYFGTSVRKFIFAQNDRMLIDIITDELYTSIITFMPQVRLTRKDITLTTDGKNVVANVRCVNVLDNEQINFTIQLLADGE
jgi:phage baseplate assembly protein W